MEMPTWLALPTKRRLTMASHTASFDSSVQAFFQRLRRRLVGLSAILRETQSASMPSIVRRQSLGTSPPSSHGAAHRASVSSDRRAQYPACPPSPPIPKHVYPALAKTRRYDLATSSARCRPGAWVHGKTGVACRNTLSTSSSRLYRPGLIGQSTQGMATIRDKMDHDEGRSGTGVVQDLTSGIAAATRRRRPGLAPIAGRANRRGWWRRSGGSRWSS
jgi:hypothetical protein